MYFNNFIPGDSDAGEKSRSNETRHSERVEELLAGVCEGISGS